MLAPRSGPGLAKRPRQQAAGGRVPRLPRRGPAPWISALLAPGQPAD